MPPWVALPTVLTTASLLCALFGMLWDISLHIDVGRDPGPLANPAHYFILFGLFGVFAGGIFACAMPLDEKPGPAAVHFIRGWDVPVGGLLLTGAGFYALLGFPLDDVWHRLFGQDVTLWGPTHLMLITGAGLSIIGLLILEQEGHGGLSTDDGDRKVGQLTRFVRQASAMGGLLLGLSVFQGEFDFDVRAVPAGPLPVHDRRRPPAWPWWPPGCSSAAAARWPRPPSSSSIRGVIALIVGPLLGEVTPTFPLYLGSAIVVELLALSVPLLRRPLVFGAVAGVADRHGRVRHRVGLVARPGDAALGHRHPGRGHAHGDRRRCGRRPARRAARLRAPPAAAPPRRRPHRARRLAGRAGRLRHQRADRDRAEARGDVRRSRTSPTTRGRRTSPSSWTRRTPLDDPSWVQITSWQGQGLVVDPLEQTGEGQYRTTQPIPIHDDWKALLRLHDGRMLSAVPIYLPADAAIPADEITADDGMTRKAIPEIQILQRELTKSGGGLWLVANLVVLACTLALIAAISWGVARYSRRAGARDPVRRAVAGVAGRRHAAGPQRAGQPLTRPPRTSPETTRDDPPCPAACCPRRAAAGRSPCRSRAAPAGPRSAAAAARVGVRLAASRRRAVVRRGRAAHRGHGRRRQASGDTGRVPVAAGTTVTLVVTSDVADEVHVHGYDMESEAGTPGSRPSCTFDATIPGVFEVELHHAGTVLLRLQVVTGHRDGSRPRGRHPHRPAHPHRPGALRRRRGHPAHLRRPAALLAQAAARRRRLRPPPPRAACSGCSTARGLRLGLQAVALAAAVLVVVGRRSRARTTPRTTSPRGCST